MGRRLGLALVIILVPVALLGYGLRSDPRAIPSPLVGKTAPDFVLPRLDGGELRSADLRGRVVVLNFWASWCLPCREEAPELEAVWRQYRGAGLVMVGVNIQDKPGAAQRFLQETRPSYPNVADASGATSIAYGIYGVPETFVIDQEGRIRLRQVGLVRADQIRSAIGPLLAGRS